MGNPRKKRAEISVAIIVVVLLAISSYAIFRQATGQKHGLKTDSEKPQQKEWSFAKARDNKEQGNDALKALNQALAIYPDNSEVLPLKKKISGYYGSNPGDTFTNSIGMKLVYIPAGEFMMGSSSGEEGRYNDEGPQHRVKISKSFYMSIYEVTQAQYRAIMGNNPSYFKDDNLPVETVSWDNAIVFCRKLSEKEGKAYRLPTEAEWEYACRAGTETRFSFGDSDSDLDGYGWYNNNSDGKTQPVGQKRPNAFGLYDMHGNVWEWCQDWYDKNYYSISPSVDPQGPNSGQYHVVRGGSWNVIFLACRSAYRFRFMPGHPYGLIDGFRVVLDF